MQRYGILRVILTVDCVISYYHSPFFKAGINQDQKCEADIAYQKASVASWIQNTAYTFMCALNR